MVSMYGFYDYSLCICTQIKYVFTRVNGIRGILNPVVTREADGLIGSKKEGLLS